MTKEKRKEMGCEDALRKSKEERKKKKEG